MKKAISFLVIAFFVFGLVSVSTVRADDQANTAGLERIPSPEQIKNFQVMKRVGNALFGVKRATSTPDGTASSSLEKIGHPNLVAQFEQIRRIGSSLWGVRKNASSTPLIISPEVAACVATAINAKDKALMERVTAAAGELNAALSARSTCQQSAVLASSTPSAALNDCVKTFNEAHKMMRETSKDLHKKIWDAYKESLKACRGTAASVSAVPMIEDGGNIFE